MMIALHCFIKTFPYSPSLTYSAANCTWYESTTTSLCPAASLSHNSLDRHLRHGGNAVNAHYMEWTMGALFRRSLSILSTCSIHRPRQTQSNRPRKPRHYTTVHLCIQSRIASWCRCDSASHSARTFLHWKERAPESAYSRSIHVSHRTHIHRPKESGKSNGQHAQGSPVD